MAPHATTVVSAEPRVISLYAEIKAIVRLHAHDTVAPPFSPAELAVMAWVCCRNYQEIIPERQIFRWAVKQFKFYANLAVEDAYNLNRYKKRERRLPYLQNLYNGIATEITLHNVPIYPVCIEPDSDDDDEPSTESPAYISTLPKSRTFLRRALGNETSAFRRFLDLPAEIRLMIYAEVFRYEGKSNSPIQCSIYRHLARLSETQRTVERMFSINHLPSMANFGLCQSSETTSPASQETSCRCYW